MNHCFDQFYLYENHDGLRDIGASQTQHPPQGFAHDNIWLVGGDHHSQTMSNNSNDGLGGYTTFHVRNNPVYNPIKHQQINGGLLCTSNILSPYGIATQFCDKPHEELMAGGGGEQFMLDLASGNTLNSPASVAQRWRAFRYLFKRLEADTTGLMSTYPILQQVKDSLGQTGIALIDTLEELYAAPSVLNAAFTTATLATLQLSSNIIEQNYASVLSIYYSTIGAGINSFSTQQLNALYNIAGQCEESGGPAVSIAKALLLNMDSVMQPSVACISSSNNSLKTGSNCFTDNLRNVWYFGDSAGIDFNTSPPSYLTNGKSYSYELAACISDVAGDLLFYVNSPTNTSFTCNVWDKNHNIMQNGSGLYCAASYCQGAIILPFPGNTTLYNIFHLGYNPNWGMYYSTVDISQNGGYGSVINKNVLFNGTIPYIEKLQAVKHANGRDWWVIAHDTGDVYYKFLFGINGISLVDSQQIGSDLRQMSGGQPSVPIYGGTGQMKFSEQGDKFALVGINGVIDLLDFDRCTGMFSNFTELGDPPYSYYRFTYGSSFSPSSNVLYVSNWDTLWQFDLTASNIKSSKQIIWINTNSQSQISQQQLGPDCKIYIASAYGISFPNSLYDSTNMYLTVINDPDGLGASCSITPFSFYLGGRRCIHDLPNLPNYSLGSVPGSICDSLTSVEEYLIEGEVMVFPNPAGDVLNVMIADKYVNNAVIRIYALYGNVTIERKAQGKNTMFDLSHLSSGLYAVAIHSEKKILIQKMFKN
jgi:hypothetical protein